MQIEVGALGFFYFVEQVSELRKVRPTGLIPALFEAAPKVALLFHAVADEE